MEGLPNLTIRTSTDVTRVLFEERRVVGVELRSPAGQQMVHARREVVLCAGALRTPQLLQLSGIGPAALLQELGIELVVDAPQVGLNLQDHRYLAVKYELHSGSLNQEFTGWRLLRNLGRYYLNGSGPLTHAAYEVVGFAKTRDHLDRPDCQIGAGLYSFERTSKGLGVSQGHGMTLGGYTTRPESRGSVRLQANDLDAPLAIEANYLGTQEDRDAALALMHFIRRYAAQPALAKYVVQELIPGPDVTTDEQILEAFINQGNTTFHYSGTCRMGSDPESVLDPLLRVRGVQGLRVADASIMPTLISGNTNAPCMVIGMRAAEFMLQAQP